MNLLWTGIAIGLALSVPIAGYWSRRTARKVLELEQRARTAERLAEIGHMTGGLAHEIKNPLSTVGLNIDLLREDLGQMQEQIPAPRYQSMDRRFEALSRETRRVREILEDFLRFAGRMELDRQPVDLNQLMEDVADFYEAELTRDGLTLRRQFEAAPSIASIDEGLIKQAVLNLLLNAAQAMQRAKEKELPHGGARELIMRTERIAASGREPDVRFKIHITDTGPGISEEHQAQIFNPYFSTRAGGTGLGLPTTRRIVEEHDGQLICLSEIGRGTDFIIDLPGSA